MAGSLDPTANLDLVVCCAGVSGWAGPTGPELRNTDEPRVRTGFFFPGVRI